MRPCSRVGDRPARGQCSQEGQTDVRYPWGPIAGSQNFSMPHRPRSMDECPSHAQASAPSSPPNHHMERWRNPTHGPQQAPHRPNQYQGVSWDLIGPKNGDGKPSKQPGEPCKRVPSADDESHPLKKPCFGWNRLEKGDPKSAGDDSNGSNTHRGMRPRQAPHKHGPSHESPTRGMSPRSHESISDVSWFEDRLGRRDMLRIRAIQPP